MKITKIGHCCLLMEENGVRLLTDPGSFSTAQDELNDIAVVLITHEHFDHLHIPSLKNILKNNPRAEVVCNEAVAKLLDAEQIIYTLMKDADQKEWSGLLVEAHESPHAEVYPSVPRVLNTGFFIGSKLFYPGDAFIQPGKAVDVLALPVAGPWMKLSEAIDYALQVKPRSAFPVHDAILTEPKILGHALPEKILSGQGIKFVALLAGESHEF